MITIFELLGRILDDLSEKSAFEMAWENDDNLLIGCIDTDIIGSLILPLLDSNDAYYFIKSSNWYSVILKMSQDQIAEVALENDSGMNITFRIGTTILERLSEIGMDDTYQKMCHEITKKCGFIVDKVKIV